MYELLWWPEAGAAMDALESTGGERLLNTLREILGRLELDPFAPDLATRTFQTPQYGHVRTTPVRFGDWTVFWTLGEREGTLEIVMIAEVGV